MMGEESDYELEKYFYEQFTEELRRIKPRVRKDWHQRLTNKEPPCARNQWRTRDRQIVMDMSTMTDWHLRHAIRFATMKENHASRLIALLEESARRKK